MSKIVLNVLGVIFLLVGIAGFTMASPLLGVFEVSALHNAIHILSGVLALWLANTNERGARIFAIVFGLVYATVAICGFLGEANVTKQLMLNTADNYLHATLAVLLLFSAVTGRTGRVAIAVS
jgi:hypothetical protein